MAGARARGIRAGAAAFASAAHLVEEEPEPPATAPEMYVDEHALGILAII